MNRTQAIALLTYRLGNRTDLESRILSEMGFVQEFILEGTGAFLPWFLETEMASSTVMIGDERVALPEDFLAEAEDQALWLYDSNNESAPYTELRKGDYDYLIAKYTSAGVPKEYSLGGDYFLLRPIPNDTYTVRMRYYAKDTPVTETEDNKWLKNAADLLIAETGKIIASEHIQNPALAAAFEQAAVIARERIYKKHESRRHANRTYGMGED